MVEFSEFSDSKTNHKIDSAKAEELARVFLSQYHNVIETKATLEDDVWIVTVDLGFSNTQSKRVKIDANSGLILGYT